MWSCKCEKHPLTKLGLVTRGFMSWWLWAAPGWLRPCHLRVASHYFPCHSRHWPCTRSWTRQWWRGRHFWLTPHCETKVSTAKNISRPVSSERGRICTCKPYYTARMRLGCHFQTQCFSLINWFPCQKHLENTSLHHWKHRVHFTHQPHPQGP